jgi:hypothetical protein
MDEQYVDVPVVGLLLNEFRTRATARADAADLQVRSHSQCAAAWCRRVQLNHRRGNAPTNILEPKLAACNASMASVSPRRSPTAAGTRAGMRCWMGWQRLRRMPRSRWWRCCWPGARQVWRRRSSWAATLGRPVAWCCASGWACFVWHRQLRIRSSCGVSPGFSCRPPYQGFAGQPGVCVHLTASFHEAF